MQILSFARQTSIHIMNCFIGLLHRTLFDADVTKSVPFLQLISVPASRKDRRRGCLPDTNPQPFPYEWAPICRPPSHQRSVAVQPAEKVRQIKADVVAAGLFVKNQCTLFHGEPPFIFTIRASDHQVFHHCAASASIRRFVIVFHNNIIYLQRKRAACAALSYCLT